MMQSIYTIYQFILLAMFSDNKSSFLITDQTNFTENIYNSSLMKIRKRINILSSSSACHNNFRKHSSSTCQSSGLHAKVAKMSFDAEMLEQDTKTELFQLNKTKQYLMMVGQDIRKTNSRLQNQLQNKLNLLQNDLNRRINCHLQRNKKLTHECEVRKQKNQRIHAKLEQIGKKVKNMQDNLGYYTAQQKLHYS